MPARVNKSKPEVDEDIQFQKQEWRVERIGWVIMGVLVLLSLLGLFGDGPLSNVEENYADGFQLTYDRFGRYLSPEELSIEIPASAIQEGQASFWIDQEFLEKIQVEDITPQPDQAITEGERTVYVFEVSGTQSPVGVKMDFRPERRWLNKGRIGWGHGQIAELSQFVYP